MENIIDFRIYRFEKNMGHGNARRKGFSECRNQIVALMDSDDISRKYRFEKQLGVLMQYPSASVIGGQISEFTGTKENVVGIREVPQDDRAIKKYLKKRCPMNQVSVMLKKDDVQRVGGYIDWYCEEDYYLWARMALKNCFFYNVPEVLVDVRVGDEMSARRGGIKYFKSEAKLQKFLLKNKLIGVPRYIYNILLRFGGEVMLPTRCRKKIFKFFRQKDNQSVKTYLSHDETEKKDNENHESDSTQKKKFPPFSVSMCVYGGDNAEWFDEALASVINQTAKPDEIVLVVDGPIPDSIQAVIDKYIEICRGGVIIFKVCYLAVNQGHGIARRHGFNQCACSLIAIMDSDDICVPTRFEEQLYIMEQEKADIVGGDIQEFIGNPKNAVSLRKVPKGNGEIRSFMKKRCPFNQMSVVFKKEAVEKAGGYLDWYCNEDYYLWLRMALNNCIFANTGTILVHVRVGEEMYGRRGGIKYYKSEAKLQKFMLKNRIINYPTYIINKLKRFIVQVLMPNRIRGWIFKVFARKKIR